MDERSVEDLLSFINGGNEGIVSSDVLLMQLDFLAGFLIIKKALPP